MNNFAKKKEPPLLYVAFSSVLSGLPECSHGTRPGFFRDYPEIEIVDRKAARGYLVMRAVAARDAGAVH